MFGPIIEGARIRLEPPRPEHSPAYLGWLADREVTRYLRDRNPPSMRQEAESLEALSADPHCVVWVIVLKDSGKLIGGTILEKIDWRAGDAESGIMIGDKSEWGQGYAGEVMWLRTDYAFAELGLRKVWTAVVAPNVASRRALEQTGYRQCGLM